jgi:hypothetical protein
VIFPQEAAMSGATPKLNQEFRATRVADLRSVTRLEESRHGPGYIFLLTLSACALAGFVLVYIILR